MAFGGARHHHHFEPDEEQIMRQVLEESKQDEVNPDNMSYEQLLALGDQVGKVSKGLSQARISAIPSFNWYPGRTASKECSICFDDFTHGKKVKALPECKHEYHEECIGKWLQDEKRCPVCNNAVK
jgi:E3 ubiquitin-protein ligase BIG BROTHER and related proteins